MAAFLLYRNYIDGENVKSTDFFWEEYNGKLGNKC